MSTIYAKGFDIYNAAVAGSMRGYNRSTNDHARYADALSQCYAEVIEDFADSPAEQQQILLHTKGKWQNAKLPLTLAMLHKHKGGKSCETHCRVYLYANCAAVFDIPLSHWQRLCAKNEKLQRKAAA